MRAHYDFSNAQRNPFKLNLMKSNRGIHYKDLNNNSDLPSLVLVMDILKPIKNLNHKIIYLN